MRPAENPINNPNKPVLPLPWVLVILPQRDFTRNPGCLLHADVQLTSAGGREGKRVWATWLTHELSRSLFQKNHVNNYLSTTSITACHTLLCTSAARVRSTPNQQAEPQATAVCGCQDGQIPNISHGPTQTGIKKRDWAKSPTLLLNEVSLGPSISLGYSQQFLSSCDGRAAELPPRPPGLQSKVHTVRYVELQVESH